MIQKGNFLFFAIVAGLWCCPSLLVAGASGQQKGNYFNSMKAYYYETDQYFDESGNLRDRGGTFKKYEMNIYVEYGLTDNYTLTLNTFYNWLTDDASGIKLKNQGFTDQEVGLQRIVANGNHGIVAIHGMLIAPGGYSLEDEPRLGYDRFGAEGALLYGNSFEMLDKYGFFDLRLGYRGYSGYPSSQIRVNADVGYDIFSRLQILTSGELHYGLKDGYEELVQGSSSIQPNYRLLKITLAARFRINEQASLVFGGYRHAWGEESGGGGGGYVSLWFNN
jgi:hypothetical protein